MSNSSYDRFVRLQASFEEEVLRAPDRTQQNVRVKILYELYVRLQIDVELSLMEQEYHQLK
jgi:hypothetical protein